MFYTQGNLIISPEWDGLDKNAISDVILVIGGTDAGKTYFVQYLYHCLTGMGRKVAYIDGDPGQSLLGPPGTISLLIEGQSTNPLVYRYFVGSTSPRGHMLQMLVGGKKLIEIAKAIQCDTIIYDTTGLIEPAQGGLSLKHAKVELFRPRFIIALQRKDELAPILTPLKRSSQINLLELSPSRNTRQRSISQRRQNRIEKLSQFFNRSVSMQINWTDYAVFPLPWFRLHGLLSLDDKSGFSLGLAIVTKINREKRTLEVISSIQSLENITTLRIGKLIVDPVTFEHRRF